MKPAGDRLAGMPGHFHSLDAVRGLAALAVVFWHWQHFFFEGTAPGPMVAGAQPLYFLFRPFYTNGWRAVHLFFSLSGFIFWWLYAEQIRARATSVREFAVLRFSRLYPLHFATLVGVAAAQWAMHRWQGSFFVYPSNDLFHFALQTVFASNWGFERSSSFNGPIWSVSVEVFLYAVFFGVARLGIRRWWELCLVILGGFLLLQFGHNARLGAGVMAFFSGALAYTVLDSIVSRGRAATALRWMAALTLLLWVVIPLNYELHLLERFYRAYVWREAFNIHGKDMGGTLMGMVSGFAFEIVLFPVSILTLALAEVRWRSMAVKWAFLGQISYSSYLLHFPLQMAFFAVVLRFTSSREFFNHPLSLLLFFALLIPLCLLSYHRFERPCQAWIRNRLLGPRRASPGKS